MTTKWSADAFAKCLLVILFVGFPPFHSESCGAHSKKPLPVPGLSGTAIPFTFDPVLQPAIIIKVSINGQMPLPFCLDTGLSATAIIEPHVAAKLRLPTNLEAPSISIGSIQACKTRLNTLSVVGKTHRDTVALSCAKPVLVGEIGALQTNMGTEHVAGILGIAALAGKTIQFDFDTHRMTISLGTRTSNPRAFTVPLRQKAADNRFYVTASLEKGITTELLLDTGAARTGIPMSVAQRLHPTLSTSTGTGSAYGLSIMPTLLLPSLYLGDCPVECVSVDNRPLNEAGYTLGIDVLSRFRVTMDFSTRLMLLERSPNSAKQVHLDGYTGIHLAEQEGHFVVQDIDQESPAHHNGVRAGDTLLDIDGHPLNSMPFLVVRRLLAGVAQTRAELTLERPDGHVSVSFLRSSEFLRPKLPMDGLFLEVPVNKPMEVVGLLHGCVGEQVGLRQGDIILEFNGKPTTEIRADVLAIEYRKTQLTLKVHRARVSEPMLFTLTAAPNGIVTLADLLTSVRHTIRDHSLGPIAGPSSLRPISAEKR